MRIHRTTVCFCVALALAAAGCGSTAPSTTSSDPLGRTRTLVIESDLPLDGPSALQMAGIVDGELLALHEVDWHVREWRVQFLNQDDTDPRSGTWNPGVTAQAAHATTVNPAVVAYIGDFDSGATATSLPGDERDRHAPGQPVEPVRRLHRPEPGRRQGRPRALPVERPEHVRAARPVGRGAGAGVRVAACAGWGSRASMCSATSRTRSTPTSRSSSPTTRRRRGSRRRRPGDRHRHEHAAGWLRRLRDRGRAAARRRGAARGAPSAGAAALSSELPRGAAAREAVRPEHARDARLPRGSRHARRRRRT